ncbi:hypothetical protein [Enterococcus ureasiticus]|uniref:Short-chain dehydrogenase n=1 Tax=Enterococcus ureasiticus TaxID=903984 RepID=A0A1E5GNJ8_9ENTE|nr:hypothetical protein [Enterococcus ureasiticus]OEG14272.1 hypothetical protein BCR21_04585 [Enterococcus ureasiticus]
MSKKVWLVTGGSKGLGLILTKSLLNNRHQIITTIPNKVSLIQMLFYIVLNQTNFMFIMNITLKR